MTQRQLWAVGGGGAAAGGIATALALALSGELRMTSAEINLPPGAQLGYQIAVASGEFELALDGTVIARVDRPLTNGDRWYITQLKPGVRRLDLTARNLGTERYNAEVRLWVGDPHAPTWKTVYTYRSSGKPGDAGAGHTVRLNVGNPSV